MLAKWGRRRAVWLVLVVALAAFIGVGYHRWFRNGPPATFASELDHFKYGSIGAEVDGLPFVVWAALPSVCSEMLPGGYASLGFITEDGHALPVGVSVRQYSIPRVGFNCATCHTARLRGSADILIGAPAEALDLSRYRDFLFSCVASEQFTATNVLAAAEDAGIRLDPLDAAVYRYAVIPRTRSVLDDRTASFEWMKRRPAHGPGRTDALNPWRQRHGLSPAADQAVATVDFPSIWAQQIRERMWLHWDGNNNSLQERNLSAALAGGATEDSLDLESIERVGRWSLLLPPPKYPYAIDANLVASGRRLYEREGCAECHDPGRPGVGSVTSLSDLGTDPDRVTTLTDALFQRMQTVGTGYSWRFTHYRRTNGYANAPLDGIWARAPYLHNGSVPTLWHLFSPDEARPLMFGRGCQVFDEVRVGYQCDGPFEFDATQRGNSNKGHRYGTTITPDERQALVEYLKTL